MKINTYLLNALDTVYMDSTIEKDDLTCVEAMRNEAASVQLAFMYEKEVPEDKEVLKIRIEIISPIKDMITVYTVENTQLERTCIDKADDWFLRKGAGLYPDRLHKIENDAFNAVGGHWKSLWLNINEELCKMPCGKHPVSIRLKNFESDEIISERTFEIEIIDACLQKQKTYATNWIHYDCMAYLSNTEPMSDEFFDVVEKYVRLAVKNGQNMILLPAFTPPLDTPVGEERETVQLVTIEKCGNTYTFDFSLLERFIKICIDCGAEYFEHNHLFTQWGAEHAPKIVVKENGEDKKMFGWHTDATSKEYKEFLHAYLTELKAFIAKNGYEKRFFFHISDEPYDKKLDSYKSASDFIHEELKGYKSGDALREYKFYEDGLVETPIVANSEIYDFYKKSSPLWMYYTGGECFDNLSNRVIGMPQERGRILGIQLYYHDIEGFLHWGFNAHHNTLARKIIDPRISGDMEAEIGGGSSYIVYPDKKGAEPSVRLITFRDGMQDIRALQLLEELTDRENVCRIIEKHIPNISFKCFVTAAQLLELRTEINQQIKNAL